MSNESRERQTRFRHVSYVGGFLPCRYDGITVRVVITPITLVLWRFRQNAELLRWNVRDIMDVSYRPCRPTYGSEARSMLMGWDMDALAATRGDRTLDLPAVS